jgi:CheY-like chemotaxis protein/two-component sensor histidine kinase
MVRLIDDLLDVSRITRGKLQLKREKVDLVEILRNVGAAQRRNCDRVGNELTVALPAEPMYVNADPVRLTQVFSNLLDNACKYTPRGGQITLRANRDGLQAVVRVEDTGIGISPEHLQRIFDLFWQAQDHADEASSGLGIGLSLVRGLVAMHGGHVEAHSRGVGQGSEFLVRLPCTASAEVGRRRFAAVPPAERLVSQRILTADDNADAAESLAMLLRMHGNDVVIAHDGVEALEVAERWHPDLVLLDLGMPRLDGYEACRRMRERSWGKKMMIVALSGWGQESDRSKSKEAGFDAHLVKPVSATEVLKLTRSGRSGAPVPR